MDRDRPLPKKPPPPYGPNPGMQIGSGFAERFPVTVMLAFIGWGLMGAAGGWWFHSMLYVCRGIWNFP